MSTGINAQDRMALRGALIARRWFLSVHSLRQVRFGRDIFRPARGPFGLRFWHGARRFSSAYPERFFRGTA